MKYIKWETAALYYRIKRFARVLMLFTIAVLIGLVCAASVNLLLGGYNHGTLGIYDTYGNVKYVISGDFKRNTDGSFTCKNGNIYKFENMLFERM